MGNCHTVGPNEALVISGGCCGNQGKKYVTGGWGWAWCLVTEVQRLSLEIMTLKPKCVNVESKKGVPLTVTGVAQVKVMTEDDYMAIACEQFLGKDESEIEDLLLETFEGHLRAIVGTMDVEEVFRDRDAFAQHVREVASTDVSKMGIKILSFTIKDLKDNVGYLDAIGQEQTANIIAQASIAKAECDRDAVVREQSCHQQSTDVKYQTETNIADYERDYKTKNEEYRTKVNTAKAEASLSYELQSSKQQKQIVDEEMNIEVIEKQRLIEVEEAEIQRREKELEATIKLPSEANAFRTTTMAEGKRIQTLKKAEGDAQKIRLLGSAEASAIEAVGKADARKMELKADAYKDYGSAAVMKLVLDALPKIAAEVSAPMNKVDEIVMIGGGSGGKIAGLTAETTKLLAELPQTVKAVTGYDITGLIGQIPGAVKVE